MALCSHSTIRTDYPFLAHPPPQKKRPTQPLPSPPPLEPTPAQATRGPRRRSSTFSAIASWAAHVQPGSPTSLSPHSPRRHPSLCKGRCPSITSVRVSASFLHIAPTPTPSLRDFKADLTTVGYTSVFLQLPGTPISAPLSVSIKPPSQNAPSDIPGSPAPSPAPKPHGLARFRLPSVLRSRGRSKSACPDTPTKMKAKAAATSAAIVRRKKTKYAVRPPPLANELALMQFVDGGDLDSNIRRIMEAQAKASDAVGVADVYRDGEGGIWWDQDEEWEYAHLLAEGNESRPRAVGDPQWVTFDGSTPSFTVAVPGEDRRGSVSTQDSDLDPKYVVQPAQSLDGDDLALFGSTAVPLTAYRPPVSVHSPQSCCAAQHLRKPDFSVDVAFSRPHASLMSPSRASAGVKPKGQTRRRPAPLKLSPPSPAFKRPTNSPIDADKVRKDFIDTSFEPASLVPATPVTAMSATIPVDMRPQFLGNSRAINVPRWTVNHGLTNLGMKPSMLNMMGLFRSARKEGAVV